MTSPPFTTALRPALALILVVCFGLAVGAGAPTSVAADPIMQQALPVTSAAPLSAATSVQPHTYVVRKNARVRTGASTHTKAFGLVFRNERVGLLCQQTGQNLSGKGKLWSLVEYRVGSSSTWRRGFIHDSLLSTGTTGPVKFVRQGHCEGFVQTRPGARWAPQPEGPRHFSGEFVSFSRVPLTAKLFGHYLHGGGKEVVIDWRYFNHNRHFMTWLQDHATSKYTTYRPPIKSDLYGALGTFSAMKTSTGCFAIYDRYDYRPDKASNVPFISLWLLKYFGAKEFVSHASGCI